MPQIFTAQFAFSEDDGVTMTAGLANSQFETSKYITFQKAHNTSEQDKRFGMEGVYIEVNDQLNSSYAGARSIQLFADRLEVYLKDKAAALMKLPIHFSVGLAPGLPDLSAFSEMLAKIEPSIIRGKIE